MYEVGKREYREAERWYNLGGRGRLGVRRPTKIICAWFSEFFIYLFKLKVALKRVNV